MKVAPILLRRGGWQVVWRDFGTTRQDREFATYKDAQRFCFTLKAGVLFVDMAGLGYSGSEAMKLWKGT